jgi:hypothetical protein
MAVENRALVFMPTLLAAAGDCDERARCPSWRRQRIRSVHLNSIARAFEFERSHRMRSARSGRNDRNDVRNALRGAVM